MAIDSEIESGSSTAIPLYAHTLDTLLNDLISGRPVLLDDDTRFLLSSTGARSLLDWYRLNRTKWPLPNKKDDVDLLADQLDKAPPSLPVTHASKAGSTARRLHLKAIRAHRFAGLHKYGTCETPPTDFVFDFEKDLTLIEGDNGSGKTSLANAITWCLTGSIHRSQRPPETGVQPVQLALQDRTNPAVFDMTAVTPMPTAQVLESLGSGSLLLDTFVELSLVDETGAAAGTLRRAIRRSRRGKAEVEEPAFEKLGLDPIARGVGTIMPGLIGYLQLGAANDLGKAVAALTGIKPLESLSEHAARSEAKLRKDLVADRMSEIALVDGEFNLQRQTLVKLLQEYPSVRPSRTVPLPTDKDADEGLTQIRAHFELLQSGSLTKATSILGAAADFRDAAVRQEFIDSVGAAFGVLSSIANLPSAQRLADLKGLTATQLTAAESAIASLVEMARELAQLAEQPERAERLRLYARVTDWLKSLPVIPTTVDGCPICSSSLDGKVDLVTGELITHHIQQYLASDCAHLGQTLRAWEDASVAGLLQQLPEPLRAAHELPDGPASLILQALGTELFDANVFQGSLSSLKAPTQTLCRKVVSSLQPLDRFVIPSLPACFGTSPNGLAACIGRVSRAIAFARWRQAHDDACREAFGKIIGGRQAAAKWNDCSVSEDLPLSQRLDALNEVVRNTEPLTRALTLVSTLEDKRVARAKLNDRIQLYGRAADAIAELVGLNDLVERQVASLMKTLSGETERWKRSLYFPAYRGAPVMGELDVTTDGALNFSATANGAKASAHHISNASDLRATLLAFLLAFWQYLLKNRGGLSLFLLDDPQELFDRYNRRLLANTLPEIVASGGRIITTTNDRAFRRQVAVSFGEARLADRMDLRRIHTLNSTRDCICLGKLLEAVEDKRRRFEEHDNDHQAARDYVNELRIYLEESLLDLGDALPDSLRSEPTLFDLIGAIQNARNAGCGAFSGPAFGRLATDHALADGSRFRKLINRAHHSTANTIMYAEVDDAKEECVRVRRMIDAIHLDYELYLRRDTRGTSDGPPSSPLAMISPSVTLRVVENLAALDDATSALDIVETGESVGRALFTNHAVYYINTRNLGFAIPYECRVVVTLSGEPAQDQSLVIALHKDRAYARRLFRGQGDTSMICLASESENPNERPPSLMFPADEVRLLPIVGVLFGKKLWKKGSDAEALLMEDWHPVDSAKLLIKDLRGNSAVPLALPGQVILGGDPIALARVSEFEGQLVALATSKGGYLKRVGKIVAGLDHVRQFEAIGGRGESLVVCMATAEGESSHLPVALSVRQVLGVLYDLADYS